MNIPFPVWVIVNAFFPSLRNPECPLSPFVRKLYIGDCGAFAWFVDFHLTGGKVDPNNGGWIIQEIEAEKNVKNCDGSYLDKGKMRWHYLEAWYVEAGANRPEYVKPPPSFSEIINKVFKKKVPPDSADVYWNAVTEESSLSCGGVGTKGDPVGVKIKGKVYFVDGLKKLPAAFKKEKGIVGAGTLPSVVLTGGKETPDQPDKTIFDYFKKADLIGPATHDLDATWKCCPKAALTEVTTDPTTPQNQIFTVN